MTLRFASLFTLSFVKLLIGIFICPFLWGGKPNCFNDFTQLKSIENGMLYIMVVFYLHVGQSFLAPAVDASNIILPRGVIVVAA